MAGQYGDAIECQGGSSCAIMEISGLCRFAGKPDEAMFSFHSHAGCNRACLVSFHGVVDARPSEKETDRWCVGCNYIQEFVAFIRDNNMGEVVPGAKAENKSAHPGHIVQAVTWAPDYKAIDKWAATFKSKVTIKPKSNPYVY